MKSGNRLLVADVGPRTIEEREDRDEGHGWDLVFQGINSAGHRVGTSEMAKRGRAGDVDSIFMTFPLESQTFRESRATSRTGARETKLEQQRHDP